MDNAGGFILAVLEISAAMPQSLLLPQSGPIDISGSSSISLDFDFRYGSGTGTVIAIVATGFDGGATWRQIARRDFAVASLVKSALCDIRSKPTTIYADLAAEGINDGLLGNILGLFLTVTGSYSGSTLGVRGAAR